MTTVFPFSAATQLPFTFQPTLDGVTYNATIGWNTFGQRPYITLDTLDGQRIFTLPLVGSTCAANFSTLSWANGVATGTIDTSSPYSVQYQPGATLMLTVADCAPDAYNGLVKALALGPETITWNIAADPGPATALGNVGYDISLTAGYFDSTLIYRIDTKQIEVSP